MTDYTDTIIRVRYVETDQMGVAHHANYLIWFDVGRTEFCRHFGFEYERMETEDDTFIVVVEASCRYKRPARFDDVLRIRTRATASQRRTVRFGYEILSETDQLIATGETLHDAAQVPGKERMQSFRSGSFGLVVQPTVAESRAAKAFHNIGTTSHGLPDKLRLIVFNHQYYRALI